MVCWNPPDEGNGMASVSKGLQAYRGWQEEKGKYLNRLMSSRVRTGLIGIRSLRGIE